MNPPIGGGMRKGYPVMPSVSTRGNSVCKPSQEDGSHLKSDCWTMSCIQSSMKQVSTYGTAMKVGRRGILVPAVTPMTETLETSLAAARKVKLSVDGS